MVFLFFVSKLQVTFHFTLFDVVLIADTSLFRFIKNNHLLVK
jgi:hypothetical protein